MRVFLFLCCVVIGLQSFQKFVGSDNDVYIFVKNNDEGQHYRKYNCCQSTQQHGQTSSTPAPVMTLEPELESTTEKGKTKINPLMRVTYCINCCKVTPESVQPAFLNGYQMSKNNKGYGKIDDSDDTLSNICKAVGLSCQETCSDLLQTPEPSPQYLPTSSKSPPTWLPEESSRDVPEFSIDKPWA